MTTIIGRQRLTGHRHCPDAELGTYTGIITGLTGEEEGLASIATWNVITPGYKTAVFSLNDDGTEVNLKLSGVATLLKIK